jgi:hypothetical protein
MNELVTKRELGFIFEDNNHILLQKTNQVVIREKDIVKKYGRLANGIDHMIFIKECPNIIIAIQDKWRDTPSQLSDINHFIRCVNHIENIEDKYIFGIYVTKKKITKGAMESFENENKICKRFNYVFSDKMECVQYKLMSILYDLEVYMYDFDGSTIMLNNDEL